MDDPGKIEAAKRALALLESTGPFGSAEQYREVDAILAPWWSEDIICGLNIVAGYLSALCSSTDDSRDREAHFDDALAHLTEMIPPTFDDEVRWLVAQVEFDQALGIEPTDEPPAFPEPT